VLVKRLTDAIGDELNDIEPGYEHTRWSLAALYEYITEALEQLAALRPELFTVSRVVQLTPGANQRIPDDFGKLLEVTQNTDENGVPGAPILQSNYVLMKHFNKPHCNMVDGVTSYKMNPNNQRVFIVNPPATAHPQQYVEVLGQINPVNITSTMQVLDLPGGSVNTYYNALKDWALYRAFMRDTESQSSLARAQHHYESFYQFLHLKVNLDGFGKQQASKNVGTRDDQTAQ
jgi:hypothetical protein